MVQRKTLDSHQTTLLPDSEVNKVNKEILCGALHSRNWQVYPFYSIQPPLVKGGIYRYTMHGVIVFSDHAKERIAKRKISKRRILAAIENPEVIVPSFRGRVIHGKRFGKKELEVVTVADGTHRIVVTAYYLGGYYENSLR